MYNQIDDYKTRQAIANDPNQRYAIDITPEEPVAVFRALPVPGNGFGCPG